MKNWTQDSEGSGRCHAHTKTEETYVKKTALRLRIGRVARERKNRIGTVGKHRDFHGTIKKPKIRWAELAGKAVLQTRVGCKMRARALHCGPGLVCRIGARTAGLAQKPGQCGLRLLVYVVKARAWAGSDLALLQTNNRKNVENTNELEYEGRLINQLRGFVQIGGKSSTQHANETHQRYDLQHRSWPRPLQSRSKDGFGKAGSKVRSSP
jgi:hypothetical protein